MSNHTYEIRRYSPSSISFYFGEAGYVGSLFVKERSLHFEGDVDKSAQTFLAGVRKLLEQEGEQEKRDRGIEENTIPRLANCGTYHAVDNTGLWHYINHAGTWQGMPDLVKDARNKAIDDACNTINRLSADGELSGCASDFVLSFASDLVQSLKEG